MAGHADGYRNGTGSWVWPVVMTAALTAVIGLLQAFWSSQWNNIASEITRLQVQVDQTQKKIDAHDQLETSLFVPRAETNEYHDRIKDSFKTMDDKIALLDAVTRRQRDQSRQDYLPKEAFTAAHQALITDVNRLGQRIEEIRKDFGSTYTLNDKIKELQDQLKSLQVQILDNRGMLGRNRRQQQQQQQQQDSEP